MVGSHTTYLSNFYTTNQEMVVDAMKHFKTILIRCIKFKLKPLLLMEVEVDSQRHSMLLQSAKIVCLIVSKGGLYITNFFFDLVPITHDAKFTRLP